MIAVIPMLVIHKRCSEAVGAIIVLFKQQLRPIQRVTVHQNGTYIIKVFKIRFKFRGKDKIIIRNKKKFGSGVYVIASIGKTIEISFFPGSGLDACGKDFI